jgi:hypothetical protein
MALTERDGMSLKTRGFLAALEALCKQHQVLLTVSGDDALEIWDLETEFGEPWYAKGIEDMTVPDSPEEPAL